MKLKTIVIFTFMALSGSLYGEDPMISASLSPSEVPVGYPATLSIQVTGSRKSPRPTLPEIPNLRTEGIGTSQNIEIINGTTSMNLTHRFRIIASKPGTYTIPSFKLIVDSKEYETNPITLRVKDPTHTETGVSSVFLKATTNEKEVFVGQPIPVEITLYGQSGKAKGVRGFPNLLSDDFNTYDFENSGTQGQTVINNTEFLTLKWNTYITPYKAGKYEIKYSEVVDIFDQSSMGYNMPTFDRFMSGRLSSFMDDFMGEATIPVEIESEALKLTVNALPHYGKPESFTGAVGEFEVSRPTISSEEIEVGEPLTLTFTLSGIGNLEQISPPNLPEQENWKLYAPKASFEKKDHFGFSGTKTFEYVLIPKSELVTSTPEFEFSSFNPKTKEYEERRIAPIDIKVKPASQVAVDNFNSQPSQAREAGVPEEKIREPLPIRLKIDGTYTTLKPLIAQTQFQLLQVIPFTLIFGLFFYRKIQKARREDRMYMKRKKSAEDLSKHIKAAHVAFAKRDAEAFYNRAQQTIADITAKSPYATASQSLTLQDIHDTLAHHAPPQALLESIEDIFHTADVIKFSPKDKKNTLDPKALEELKSLIEKLENLL